MSISIQPEHSFATSASSWVIFFNYFYFSLHFGGFYSTQRIREQNRTDPLVKAKFSSPSVGYIGA